MKSYNIHEAKTQLSRLIDLAEKGEPFIIARAGKPVVKVERVTTAMPRRIGFLAGQADIPDDFDTLHRGEIEKLFGTRGGGEP